MQVSSIRSFFEKQHFNIGPIQFPKSIEVSSWSKVDGPNVCSIFQNNSDHVLL